MSEQTLIKEILQQLLHATEIIFRRIKTIKTPDDFFKNG
jgi:hypothetical protein